MSPMVRHRVRRLLLPIVAVLTIAGCAGTRPPLPTMERPETPELRSRAYGTVVWHDKGVRALDVRSGDQWLVREWAADVGRGPFVLSGPAVTRRYAAIEMVSRSALGLDMLAADHFVLATRTLRGDQPIDVFDREGDLVFDDLVAGHLAQSPDGERVAFVSDSGRLGRATGVLEIWNITTREREATVPHVIGGEDGGLSWLPDSRRLAVSVLLPASDPRLLATSDADVARFRDGLEDRGTVPCLFVYDAPARTCSYVHPGAMPAAGAADGSVLVRGGPSYPLFGGHDAARPWRRVDLRTGTSSSVEIPGDWRGVIGVLRDGLVVYLGLPTAGGDSEYTTNNSPLVGAKPMGSVKLADPATGAFVTLVPAVDPRWDVVWGPGSEDRDAR